MTISAEEAQKIRREFERTYFLSTPYNGYTMGTSLRTIREYAEQKGPEFQSRQDGLSLDDYCLIVTLRKVTIPKTIQYPRSFQSLKIFYEVQKGGIGF